MPDLPGWVATGRTAKEARARLGAAIRLHLDGLRADGLERPAPTTVTDDVEV